MGGRPPAERADEPSPRTRWSTSAQTIALWTACTATLRTAAQAYQAQAAGGTALRLVLLGDSITEQWGGNSMCRSTPKHRSLPAVLLRTLGALTDVPPLVLGIGGDQTQHLLWRLQNGELTAAMRSDPTIVYTLLIGTNNLPRGHNSSAAAAGVLAVARQILSETKGRILLNALLPRSDAHTKKAWERYMDVVDKKPSFLPAIDRVNVALRGAAVARGSLAEAFPQRVAYVDCGARFLLPPSIGSAPAVSHELMPDRLHPNAAGYSVWAGCMQEGLRAAGWLAVAAQA